MLMRHLYTTLWACALPVVGARLWWKGRRQPAYRADIAERFGRYTGTAPRPCLWIHAVSVGETRAAQPLVTALLARYPTHHIVLTHMTPTGRATAQTLFADMAERVHSVYLPYDLPWLQARFVAHFRPALGIVMETEVWPNLVAACAQRATPLILANGRLSQRSAQRYARLGTLARAAFGGFAVVAAQTDADARRFAALGATRVEVTGNIKFDIAPTPAGIALGMQWSAAIGVRQVVLAASTREGEEAQILDAARALIADGALLVIVPRHPQRFDAVAQQIRATGLRFGRRSAGSAPDAHDAIWLGDSMGEMAAYYALADVALMGGTWLPFGGQNLIECCAAGTPVLLGPHTYNFLEASEQAIAAGAARRSNDAADALRVARTLLAAGTEREAMGAAGKRFAQQHGGATARTLALIAPLVSAD